MFSVELDRNFLKMCAKSLVKITRIREVKGRKRPTTFRNLSFQFPIKIVLSKHVVLIMRIINIIINMDDIRQERPNESPILKLNKRLKQKSLKKIFSTLIKEPMDF